MSRDSHHERPLLTQKHFRAFSIQAFHYKHKIVGSYCDITSWVVLANTTTFTSQTRRENIFCIYYSCQLTSLQNGAPPRQAKAPHNKTT